MESQVSLIRKRGTLLVSSLVLALVLLVLLVPGKTALASGSGGIIYRHIATAANSAGNYTDIDNSIANNNPNAIITVTPSWEPNHVYNNHAIGVWYHNSKWSIFNQDGAAIPVNAAFNVYAYYTSSSTLFTHVATTSNTSGNYTDINAASTNGNPNAILLVTPNWQPNKIYNNHPIGVWYHSGKWSIFNQDLAAMPKGAGFNVVVLSTQISGTLIHIATKANSAGNYTDITSSVASHSSKALVFITANYQPYSVYNKHNTGVWYHGSNWSIFNQDSAAIPMNAAFNVLTYNP